VNEERHPGRDLLPFIDGTLNDEDRAAIERHIAHCAACAAELAELRTAARALRSSAHDAVLPSETAARIAARLAHPVQGTSRRLPLLQMAAAVLLLLIGGAVGCVVGSRSSSSPATVAAADSLPVFALLLEEPEWPPPGPLDRPGYMEWADDLRAAERMAGGEKLTDEPGLRVHPDGRVVRPDGSDGRPGMSGFFLVRAANYDDAVAWVRRGPHLRYGSVLVRQVE
jgi:hypothetical protein